MKLLFIAEADHYRDWVGKTYYDILIHYKEKSKNEIKLIFTDMQLTIANINNWKPDIIVFFDTDTLRFADRYEFLFNLNIPIFASSLDFFYFNRCIACPWIKKCRGLIHFGYATKMLSAYKEYFPNKIIKSFKGRFINTKRYKNYNLEKKYDILIYGTRCFMNYIEPHKADQEYKIKYEEHYKEKLGNRHSFYPLRNRIEKILCQNKHKYNLHILDNRCIYDAIVANEDLSRLINQSWLTMATTSRADLPMAKYFEIAGSYSGILGNIPTDYEELFKNNIVEVNEWMSDKEILDIIDKSLEDKQKLQEMINNLGNRIHNEYSLKESVTDMDKIYDEIYEINVS